MFLVNATRIFRSAMIEFITICARDNDYTLSFCPEKSVLMIGNRGMITKTNLEGTRPLSFILSFIDLILMFRMRTPEILSCWSLTLL